MGQGPFLEDQSLTSSAISSAKARAGSHPQQRRLDRGAARAILDARGVRIAIANTGELGRGADKLFEQASGGHAAAKGQAIIDEMVREGSKRLGQTSMRPQSVEIAL